MAAMDTFERDGLVLDVRDHAPDHGGEPAGTVVLLHGFPQDASAYDAVVPLLTAEGLRVLVPDQRGYSPRARPRGRSPYVMDELVDDVVALLDQAGVAQAHVVGHDWGGGVAWTFAGRRRDRTLSLTALSTPHPAAMVWGMRHGDQARRSSYMAWFQVPRVPERVLLAERGARLREALVSSQLPDPFVDRYVTRLLEPGALTAALAWYRALPVTRGRGAGRTRVPTVYVHGLRDPFFARESVAATGRYVAAPFTSVPVDTGHWIPETHPTEVAAAVLALAFGRDLRRGSTPSAPQPPQG